MTRRALLGAAAPAVLLAACGDPSTEPAAVPQRGRSETADKGDQELLAFLIGLEAAAGEDGGPLRARLGGEPLSGSGRPGEPQLIAAYLDALPKLTDPELRALAFDRLVEHARHEAAERDEPLGDAFVDGELPA